MRRVWNYFFGPERWDFSNISQPWRALGYVWIYGWALLFLAVWLGVVGFIVWAIYNGYILDGPS